MHSLDNNLLVKVEPEYDTYKDGTVESGADKETGKCRHDLTDDIRNSSKQNDKKEVLDLEKFHGIAAICVA